MKINELLQKRAALAQQTREITTKATETEKRALTTEETVQVDKIFAEIGQIDNTVRQMKQQAELDRTAAADHERQEEQRKKGETKDDINTAFRSFLISGHPGRGAGADAFRALQADVDTTGGYTVAPPQFQKELIKNVDDILYFRQKARVFPLIGAESMGVPTLTADPSDADWTGEITAVGEDSSMTFGKRQLMPKPLSKLLKVSRQLMRVSALPIESIIADRMAYKMAVPQERAFFIGSGAGQPLGVFTASADGITTTQDVSTGNTGTAITFDGLSNAKYKLKVQYQKTAEWFFHRDAIKQIAQLKDGMGQYLWQPTKTAADPDMILGRPVNQSEYVPNTFTSGLYVGGFFDLSHYWIAESQTVEVQRLDELYAGTNQVGFIIRAQIDAQPVLSEAFARVKLG